MLFPSSSNLGRYLLRQKGLYIIHGIITEIFTVNEVEVTVRIQCTYTIMLSFALKVSVCTMLELCS